MNNKTVTRNTPVAFSVDGLCEHVAVSAQFIRAEIRRGNLKASRLGRRIVIPAESVREWVNRGMEDHKHERSIGQGKSHR